MISIDLLVRHDVIVVAICLYLCAVEHSYVSVYLEFSVHMYKLVRGRINS